MKNLVKQAAALLGVNEATLERMASDIARQNPDLKDHFDKNVGEEGLDDLITQLEKELEDVLNHGRSPNVAVTRRRE